MTAPETFQKPQKILCTTFQCVHFLILSLFLLMSSPVMADTALPTNLPLFRHIDPVSKRPAESARTSFRLLTDQDFPPFSYQAPDGTMAGISVDMALTACLELKFNCTIVSRPFEQLLPALLGNEGDVIISGLKINENVLKKTAMTRPYFWSLGRFAVTVSSQVRSSDIRTLAGKRIGAVAGTSHAAWLQKYYARSTLAPFPTEVAMFDALQKGSIEAVFGDDLRISFWLDGSASKGCCKALDGAYVDRYFFSHNLAFLARREDEATIQAFDHALDRLQEKGASGQTFARYLPNGIW
jgi:polar amino acid transport system substrate-binding protein